MRILSFILVLGLCSLANGELERLPPVDHDTGTSPASSGRYEAPDEGPRPKAVPPRQLFQPGVGNYDAGNAAIFSWLSYLAYLKKPNGSPDLERIARELHQWPGATIQAIDHAPVQGFILKANGVAVVVFRGSDETADWLDNMQAVFHSNSAPRQMGRPNLIRPQPKRPDSGMKGDLHMGFHKQASLVHDQILSQLKGLEGSQVWFTGHSLGGALASIYARHLHESHGFKKTGLYTFGAPRAGNQDHAKYFTDHQIPAHRVEFKLDPVPGLPGSLRFRSVGELKYVDEGENGCEPVKESAPGQMVRYFRSKVGLLKPGEANTSNDHSIVRYVDCLTALTNTSP